MTFIIPHHSADNSKELLARNPNTSVATLEKLAKDEDWRVRYHIAVNPNTSAVLLEKLAEDEDEDVRARVIERAKELTDTDFALYVTAIAKSYD